jgi:hypothetical protein
MISSRSRRSLVGATLAVLIGLSVGRGSAASLSLSSQMLTPYRTCVLSAIPTTTASVVDATVKQGSATSNFGTATTSVVSSASGANQRSYVRFDLTACSPSIPSTATVRLATLRLYLSGLPTACRTIDVFRVTASWTETGLTWTNQPFGTTINNPASGSRTAAIAVGTPSGCANLAAGYIVGGSVTADVAAFVAGSTSNFGWMLRDDVEGSSTTRTSTFSAKELAAVGQVPQLVVTYVAVP